MTPSTSKPLYSADFYGEQAPGSAGSAMEVLPLVFQLLVPACLVDVGCGVGTWLRAATDLGVPRVVGVDGNHAQAAGLQIDPQSFIAADLDVGCPTWSERFDIALSLEVAEHLTEDRSDSFVEELCAASDVVVFSAAIPGQLGTGHINLKPQSAWVTRFDQQGYSVFDFVRPQLWGNQLVDTWYRQNLLVFVKSSRDDLVGRAAGLQSASAALIDVVHPDLLAFWVRRATRPVSTKEAMALAWHSARRAIRRRIL